MSLFEKIAPYPDPSDPDVAEALSRNYAVLAHVNLTRGIRAATEEARHEGRMLALHMFSVVVLLRAVDLAGGKVAANQAAADLMADLAAPHCMRPAIHERLVHYGINVADVDKAIAELPEMQAAPEAARPARRAS